MPILPLSAHVPRPVAQAASFTGLVWPMVRESIYKAGRFLGKRRQALQERRLHAQAINSLQGVPPEVLRDIGAAPDLIAELEAAEQFKQGRLGRPQYW